MYTAKRVFQILREDGPVHLTRKASLFLRYRRPIESVYRKFVKWNRTRSSSYDALANPYKKIEVDPNDIEYMSGLEYDIGEIGVVVGGDWDTTTDSFEEYDMYQGFKQRFKYNYSWPETVFYQRVRDQIESGKMKFGCETVEELNQRCNQLDELYLSIKKNGYLSGENRTKDDPMEDAKRKNYLKKELDEIKVDIGRNGEFLFVDGRHRLAMTKILGLDAVPVIVLRRHKEWQEIREKASKHNEGRTTRDYSSDHKEHPDLQDIQ